MTGQPRPAAAAQNDRAANDVASNQRRQCNDNHQYTCSICKGTKYARHPTELFVQPEKADISAPEVQKNRELPFPETPTQPNKVVGMVLTNLRTAWVVLSIALYFNPSQAFVTPQQSRSLPTFLPKHDGINLQEYHNINRFTRTATSSTSLYMVFDFFKKRAEEGVEQLSNLATSAALPCNLRSSSPVKTNRVMNICVKAL